MFSEETAAMLAEIVVHSGIEHITAQPMPSAFPYLPNEECVRILRFHCWTESSPEGVINFARYIQPPAINVKFPDPIGADFGEIVPYLRVSCVQFRHHPLVSEAGVGWVLFWVIRTDYWKVQMIKPVFVFGRFLIAYHIIESEEIPATVVEYPIDDDADTPPVEFVYHEPKRLVPAEAGIYMVIIQQIIFVVLPRCEYRVKVDAVDPQILKISGIFRHSP